MTIKKTLAAVSFAAVAFTIITTHTWNIQAATPANSSLCQQSFIGGHQCQTSMTPDGLLKNAGPARLAQDAHTQACQYNYNQCMTGCGGAASCSNQCKANFDGCLSQGR
jgi:hypothetical protein